MLAPPAISLDTNADAIFKDFSKKLKKIPSTLPEYHRSSSISYTKHPSDID
jgi:hypothetical protein